MTAVSADEAASDHAVRALAAERLTFFGDAVVAIALTLLALDLPLPQGKGNAEFWQSALAHQQEYQAFLISFLVIGAHWSAHHRVFRYVTEVGGRLGVLTFGWLLAQVITPFATKVLTGDGAFQLRFGFYALVQTVAGACFLVMLWEIRRYRLHRADTPPQVFSRAVLHIAMTAGGFLVSIPLALLTTDAYVCWVAFPVASTLIARVWNHAARRSDRRPVPGPERAAVD